jgi:hypothetical protein
MNIGNSLYRYFNCLVARLRYGWTLPQQRLKTFSSTSDYVEAQCRTNESKRDNVWVREAEVARLCEYLQARGRTLHFGLCHGVRNGIEVKWFRERLGIHVIGTDISPSAVNYEHVVQWDFHDFNLEWDQSVDFIYSNSLDHSHSPVECLRCWLRTLSDNGVCLVHWSPGHNHLDFGMNGADCFQATRDGYRACIADVPGVILDVVELDSDRCVFVVAKS